MKSVDPLFKPSAFYIGLVLNTCSVFLFLIGAYSASWIVMSVASPEMLDDKGNRLVAHYGPWMGCTYGGICDDPWVILNGVDEKVRLIQFLIVLTSAAYIVGLMAMTLQVTRPNLFESLGQKIDAIVVVEFVFPVAATTGFLMMLIMGSMNKDVIAQDGQSMQTSSGFFMTLLGVLLSVSGIVCTILNQHADSGSRVALYIRRWNRHFGKGGMVTEGSLLSEYHGTSGPSVWLCNDHGAAGEISTRAGNGAVKVFRGHN
ncbi:hypothetical protein Btru_075462 [Bulinus truncatus]|nr:hypothetical protein Btru_075462 [Bulinus truncatus]